jgi:hypothetical protein
VEEGANEAAKFGRNQWEVNCDAAVELEDWWIRMRYKYIRDIYI